MARFSPGDQIVCRIADGDIVNIYHNAWEKEEIFDIVSIYEEGYMIYIPLDLYLKDTITLTKDNYKKFNINKKFIDSQIYYITEHKIVNIYSKIDGLCCSKCEIFCNMAASNQADGSFICWNCTSYPFYK